MIITKHGAQMVEKQKIAEVFDSAIKSGRNELTEYESKQVLTAWEIPVSETRLVKEKPEAVEEARNLKYPVVMKIASPDILRKSDAGGVRVGISSELKLKHAFDDIMINVKAYKPDADIWGVTVQKYFPQKREATVSLFQDLSFGTVMAFGMGGLWGEILEDTSFRLAPTSPEDIRDMVEEVKGYPVLFGDQGGGSLADIDALVNILQKVSQLPSEFDEILEVDLNPIFVFDEGEGAIAVDALIKLKEPEKNEEK